MPGALWGRNLTNLIGIACESVGQISAGSGSKALGMAGGSRALTAGARARGRTRRAAWRIVAPWLANSMCQRASPPRVGGAPIGGRTKFASGPFFGCILARSGPSGPHFGCSMGFGVPYSYGRNLAAAFGSCHLSGLKIVNFSLITTNHRAQMSGQ